MTGSRLAGLTISELADRERRRLQAGNGQHYTQKPKWTEKNRARDLVLKGFSKRSFPGSLSILTMPHLDWRFENDLLMAREPTARMVPGRKPRNTYITAIERDEAIYRAAFLKMPGLVDGLAQLDSAPYATTTTRTHKITRFHRCEFEALAMDAGEWRFDGAWVDFNGQITSARLRALANFWECHLRTRLVVTCMAGRYCPETVLGVAEYGSLMEYVKCSLPRSRTASEHYYSDGTPMAQWTWDKF